MTAPEPFTTDALWSAGEVREQSRQVTGQLDVWDAIEDTLHAELRPCAACNAESGAPCDPLCIGLAAELDRLEP